MPSAPDTDPLIARTATARAAAVQKDWAAGYAELSQVALDALTVDDLGRLAECAWWTGDLDTAIAAREREYSSVLDAGDSRRAGLIAIELARDHAGAMHGAVSRGWFASARRLLEDDEDCVEHGYLLRTLAHQAGETGEHDRAIELARLVAAHGRRFQDRTLVVLGLHEEGLTLVRSGAVEAGMALLEETMVSAVSGELSPFWTGAVYCNLINVCHDLADYGRAGEWTEVAKRWCEAQDISGFPGICRIRRGEVIRLRGGWAQAEAEMHRACDELATHYVGYMGAAWYEIAEIRLRMGDLEAAEEALATAHQLGTDPQPALAVVYLARGEPDAALASLASALAATDVPPLGRARLLPGAIEVLLAAADHVRARALVDELVDIADAFQSPALGAMAATARGMESLAVGDISAATTSLRAALTTWQALDTPYEAARVRLLLGEALEAAGDDVSAGMERRSAQHALEALGADLDIARPHLNRETPQPTGRTFVFTDIVRSTDLLQVIGDEAWAAVRRWQDQLVRKLVEEYEGEVVKDVGDGYFLSFAALGRAVDCAVRLQRELAQHRRVHGFSPQVRVGLHTGSAVRDGTDYAGAGVNCAARISATAAGDEILASRSSLENAGRHVIERGRRTITLKGIPEPIEVVSIDWS